MTKILTLNYRDQICNLTIIIISIVQVNTQCENVQNKGKTNRDELFFNKKKSLLKNNNMYSF